MIQEWFIQQYKPLVYPAQSDPAIHSYDLSAYTNCLEHSIPVLH